MLRICSRNNQRDKKNPVDISKLNPKDNTDSGNTKDTFLQDFSSAFEKVLGKNPENQKKKLLENFPNKILHNFLQD